MVDVGHAKALSDVETEQACKCYWEEDGDTGSEEHCDINHSEDVAVLEGDNEGASRVEIRELLDRLTPAPLRVSSNKTSLIIDTLHIARQPPERELNRRREDVERHSPGDQNANILEPLCVEVVVHSSEEPLQVRTLLLVRSHIRGCKEGHEAIDDQIDGEEAHCDGNSLVRLVPEAILGGQPGVRIPDSHRKEHDELRVGLRDEEAVLYRIVVVLLANWLGEQSRILAIHVLDLVESARVLVQIDELVVAEAGVGASARDIRI